jgi:probable phosphoglycerate mutase
MDLLWVRHAEPERVAGGTGVPANPGLTERGRAQAGRLADWLVHEHIDVVVSSPQRRARETAEPIAAAHGLAVAVVDGLVEYDVQADHYIPMEELRASNDERLRAMIEGRWESFGGESTAVFRDRVARTIDEIVGTYPGRRVVAVCHGGVINVAFAVVLGLDQMLWFDPQYTSLSRMAASRNGARSVVSVNEHAHLEGTRETRAEREVDPVRRDPS